ncbi:hypothetical protein [Pseudonocardia asaccharolytica]|uniref:Uncharacterized protein n=1 Tax=Pseudonocardia asaccharolytica DSM 44247 = NBRC 16224 TaxID=1123024 RepID=A0A511CVQ7_9PSEU|nr:hypothetical protein [Pseudonocardia asaccharolytica]GEL16323.1 hypothetical protein PA7_01600 [Pseudonocardia asaccharolytica DSM 44247 = NBRC 16224]
MIKAAAQVPDPTALYRIRDGSYAADLLIAAVAECDLRSYFGSLAERPTARELADVLRTDRQAAWASAGATADDRETDWSGRLGDAAFAQRFTAAMDARGPSWVRPSPTPSRTSP